MGTNSNVYTNKSDNIKDVLILAKNVVRILNHTFTITAEDDKDYMEKVASKIERKVKRLSDELHTRNMTEVSLFVAMDYCDQYTKAMEDNANLRGQIKDYLQESAFTRKQYDDAKKENEQLRAEINALRARLSERASAAKTAAAEEKPDAPSALRKAEKPAPDNKKIRKQEKPTVKPETAVKAPIEGKFTEDVFGETADAAAEIMSFFEQKSFLDDDDDE